MIKKMLKCTKCNITKNESEFHKWSSHKRGYRYHCKECRKGEGAKYKRAHYHKNKETYKDRHNKWIEDNREQYNEYMRDWRKDNLEYGTPKQAADSAYYRRAKRQASLYNFQKEKILEVYRLCSKLKKELNLNLQVDHIYPITNDKMSGLHVWWNLQIITAKENQSKSNKIIKNKIVPRVVANFDTYIKEVEDVCRAYAK